MRVNNVDNSSFGMAWQKAAKPFLVEAITTLSSSKQSKAVEIVNRLEQNSPFHELSINSPLGFFYARPLRPEVGSLREDFLPGESKIGFFSALKGLDKFVSHENGALAIRQPIYSTLTEVLGSFAKKDILDPGVRMFGEYMPKILGRWSAQMAENGRSVGSVVKQIKRIDELAKATDVKVYIRNNGVSACTKNIQNIFGFDNKKVELKHLDYIENALKTYARMKKGKVAFSYAFDDFRTKVADKKVSAQLASAEFMRKLRATRPFQYLASAKQKFVEKMKERALQREQDLHATAQKIAEGLKI